MRWTMRITRWGWSLYFSGQLVASADNPLKLLRTHANLTTDGEN